MVKVMNVSSRGVPECLVDIFAIAITKRPCGAVDDEVMWLICLLDAGRRRCSHVGILIQ
jgi:hypothetical protein